MRIGTWNLKLCPPPGSVRGGPISAWLDDREADVWLLTEVHADWDPGRTAVSPRRSHDPDELKRWAAIRTTRPLARVPAGVQHPGDEALALARIDLDGLSVLVACSVLPWRGAGPYWRGLPDGQFEQFRCVLDHHVTRITAARRPGEPLVWGGDFNQELTPPVWAGTNGGAAVLRAAFECLELVPLTQGLAHLNGQTHTIDHLAVSTGLLVERVEVHRPTGEGAKPLSDHAAYVADVVLPRTHGI